MLYIADTGNHHIRKLRDGVVRTYAGSGEPGFQDGDSDVAQSNSGSDIALDGQGHLLVADLSNHRIRVVSTDGATTTLAGTGDAFREDGPAATATLNKPNFALSAPDGSVYVVQEHSIRKISTDGIVTTIAGSTEDGFVDGRGNNARFDKCFGMDLTACGTLIVSDSQNNRLRRVDPNNGHTTKKIEHPFENPVMSHTGPTAPCM